MITLKQFFIHLARCDYHASMYHEREIPENGKCILDD